MLYEDYKRTHIEARVTNNGWFHTDCLGGEIGVTSRRYYEYPNDVRIDVGTYGTCPTKIESFYECRCPDSHPINVKDWDDALQQALNHPMTFGEHQVYTTRGINPLLEASIRALYFMRLARRMQERRANKDLIPVKVHKGRLPDFNLDVQFEPVDEHRNHYHDESIWGRYRFEADKTNIQAPTHLWCPYDKNLRIAEFDTTDSTFRGICPMFMSLQPCNKSWRILFHPTHTYYQDEPIIIGTAQSVSAANAKATSFIAQLALGVVTCNASADTDKLWKLPDTAGVVVFEDYPLAEALEIVHQAELSAWKEVGEHPYARFFKEKVNEVFIRDDKAEHTFNPLSGDFEI